jgi:hypothetical protein
LLESSAIRFQSVEENQRITLVYRYSLQSQENKRKETHRKTKEEPNTNKKEKKKKNPTKLDLG